jgi:hypothetical protein
MPTRRFGWCSLIVEEFEVTEEEKLKMKLKMKKMKRRK